MDQGIEGRLNGLAINGTGYDDHDLRLLEQEQELASYCHTWANCFEFGNWAKSALHHYRVEFEPPELTLADRKWVWKRQQSRFPYEHEFDGEMLHNLGLISDEAMKNVTTTRVRLSSGTAVDTKLELVKPDDPMKKVYTHRFYDSLCERLFLKLNYRKLGQSCFDFDRTKSVTIDNCQLTIATGFRSKLREHNDKILLALNSMQQVIQADNVYQLMSRIKTEVKSSGGSKEVYQQLVRAELIGCTVITPHNLISYKIEDIYWHETPATKMATKNGQTSYMEYHFERYGLTISNKNQPLLISYNQKFWGSIKGGEPARLIPELCNMLDLSPTMRRNVKLVKELNSVLDERSTPDKNTRAIVDLVKEMHRNPDTHQILVKWGLEIKQNLVEVNARQLPVEKLRLVSSGGGNEPMFVPATDLYSRLESGFTDFNCRVAIPSPMKNWICVAPRTVAGDLELLIAYMQEMGLKFGIQVEKPANILYSDPKTTHGVQYLKLVQQAARQDPAPSMVMVVLPDGKPGFYERIKETLCTTFGQPSQCILARTLARSEEKLRKVAARLVLQMNVKLGGKPWDVFMPAEWEELFIVGYAEYTDTQKGLTFEGMVATCNRMDFRTYASSVHQKVLQESREHENMQKSLTMCIETLAKVLEPSETLPRKVLFYRYAGSGSEDSFDFEKDLRRVKDSLKSEYKKLGLDKPSLAFTVVGEDKNIRFFKTNPDTSASTGNENTVPAAAAALAVADTITYNRGADFYLLTQGDGASSRTGFVPTYFHMIHDNVGFDPEKFQWLTYKLCHVHYNAPGPVRMPAQVQYALELARFWAGIYRKGMAVTVHPILEERLYFL